MSTRCVEHEGNMQKIKNELNKRKEELTQKYDSFSNMQIFN